MNTLKNLREKNKISLSELSNATRIALSTLSHVERGKRKPTFHQLVSLSKFFNVPISDLTDDPLFIENTAFELNEVSPKVKILIEYCDYLTDDKIDVMIQLAKCLKDL